MVIIFVALVVLIMVAELRGNPLLDKLHIDKLTSIFQSGGNMEGKETRFGDIGSSLFVIGFVSLIRLIYLTNWPSSSLPFIP